MGCQWQGKSQKQNVGNRQPWPQRSLRKQEGRLETRNGEDLCSCRQWRRGKRVSREHYAVDSTEAEYSLKVRSSEAQEEIPSLREARSR